jgi:hypothetical protein
MYLLCKNYLHKKWPLLGLNLYFMHKIIIKKGKKNIGVFLNDIIKTIKYIKGALHRVGGYSII